MGQKVNPVGLRAGPKLNKRWASNYYADKEYGDLVNQDLRIRRMIEKDYSQALVSDVFIERSSQKTTTINIYVKKPGVIIGKSGSDIEKLKKKVKSITDSEVYININEVKRVDADAKLIAKSIATQLEKRVSYRRAMKRALTAGVKAGLKGIKICCSGRLAGSEIARTEWYKEGRIPLHTLRADIDYSASEAVTTYGVIGVKVWTYKGDSKQ